VAHPFDQPRRKVWLWRDPGHPAWPRRTLGHGLRHHELSTVIRIARQMKDNI
jgi:hypothetical protein